MNIVDQNTTQSGRTRKRGAKDASNKVVEKQKRHEFNKQIKGNFWLIIIIIKLHCDQGPQTVSI